MSFGAFESDLPLPVLFRTKRVFRSAVSWILFFSFKTNCATSFYNSPYCIRDQHQRLAIDAIRSVQMQMQIHGPKKDNFRMTLLRRQNNEETSIISNEDAGDADKHMHKHMHKHKEEAQAGYLTYVHESIGSILDADPIPIPPAFSQKMSLNENSVVDVEDDLNLMFVNEKSCTIKWSVFDKFIQWKNKSTSSSISTSASTTISVEIDDLIMLASECEQAVFGHGDGDGNKNVPATVQGLIEIQSTKIKIAKTSESEVHKDDNDNDNDGRRERTLIATLLSLNMVESSIRNLTDDTHGRAPLLKDMIEKIENSSDVGIPIALVPILRTLLLPSGINLRNLLWHGFLPGIKTHWLALSIVLTLSMDDLRNPSYSPCDFPEDNVDGLNVMRTFPKLAKILDHGRSILSSPELKAKFETRVLESSFIPSTHKDLCRVCFNYTHSPVIFSSVCAPMIEHALRLLWCIVNERTDDCIAKDGAYYVTLDGHGQRDKHDVVLLPNLSTGGFKSKVGVETTTSIPKGEEKSKLVDAIGEGNMAFLIDLFASPPGSPNIRAALAHGSYSKHLLNELLAMHSEPDKELTGIMQESSNEQLHDMSCALISVLDIFSSPDDYCGSSHNNMCQDYGPIFSYSSSLLREIDNLIWSLEPLSDFVIDMKKTDVLASNTGNDLHRRVSRSFDAVSKNVEDIKFMRLRILHAFGADSSESVPCYCAKNEIASKCGAAKLLLEETARATTSYLEQLSNAMKELDCFEKQPPNSRRRKQIMRIISISQLSLDFYSFASFCALLYIEHRVLPQSKVLYPILDESVLFLAVKRSRMVVSTYSTVTMVDRALKAVEVYSFGKAFKAISAEIEKQKKRSDDHSPVV